jgi:hypothetical protein
MTGFRNSYSKRLPVDYESRTTDNDYGQQQVAEW